jgi:hypothetical protein
LSISILSENWGWLELKIRALHSLGFEVEIFNS